MLDFIFSIDLPQAQPLALSWVEGRMERRASPAPSHVMPTPTASAARGGSLWTPPLLNIALFLHSEPGPSTAQKNRPGRARDHLYQTVPRERFSEDLNSMFPRLGLSQRKWGSRSRKALGHGIRYCSELSLAPCGCGPPGPVVTGWPLPPLLRQTAHTSLPCVARRMG